VDLLSNK